MIFFMMNVNACQKRDIDNAILMHALRTSLLIHPLMQLLNDPLSVSGHCLLAMRHYTLLKELIFLDKTC